MAQTSVVIHAFGAEQPAARTSSLASMQAAIQRLAAALARQQIVTHRFREEVEMLAVELHTLHGTWQTYQRSLRSIDVRRLHAKTARLARLMDRASAL